MKRVKGMALRLTDNSIKAGHGPVSPCGEILLPE